LYEALRTAVLAGQPHAEGCAALRFHGMVGALATLLRTTPLVLPARTAGPLAAAAPRDPQLVRLLANLVLATHTTEITHVY
jgi:hypothetical protein